MADLKITALTELTTPADEDLIAIVDDPTGVAQTKKITKANLLAGAGDVSTDSIFDAKGDLIGGTGADTAARLPIGSNGQRLVPDSGETTGLKWTNAIGFLNRQGGDADDWATGGTTDYTETNALMQAGFTGNITNGGSLAVTFPVAFAQKPVVIAICGSSANANFTVVVNSTTQCTIYNHGSLSRPAFWIAIGRST